jgi:putative toxin-antitoxin system antitoxin component (TIGR02293 family)
LTARLGLSRATVAQRKADGRLTSDESGKVVCFARLLGHAVHLFGDLEEARQWLKTPQRGLHGAVPLDYAKTEMGAREVENLLSQLNHSSPR